MSAITFLAVTEDEVTPGVTAFLVVAALGVTLFFLIRSMNKRISRIQAPHEEDLRQADWERRQAEAVKTPEKQGPDADQREG
ncbi:hypothetical protein [Actinomadura sp. DC4]|uniref:hypothetical protein n=1 Tax=Actinomadura sp. DC4 TaxID=3055069 RepID=UPI0025B20004|nr:hypothetical protein [Actinomadura sp. DC4]MDN3352566.1 hypothetical protein [Actinomadura sp. DC4]